MSNKNVSTDIKPWDIFKNSFEVLYPAKLDWVIGGHTFTQYELGWVELMHMQTKIVEIANRGFALGVLTDLDMSVINNDDNDLSSGLSYIFIRIMDRSRWYIFGKLIGLNALPLIASVFGKHTPAMCINTPLYAMILRTDKLDVLDRHMTPSIAAEIQVAFLQQNDVKMIVENLKPQEGIDKDIPSLGGYQPYIEMKQWGIEVQNDWSPRKADFVRRVFYKLRAAESIEKQGDSEIERMLNAWSMMSSNLDVVSQEHRVKMVKLRFDVLIKQALFGEGAHDANEETDSDEIPVGDY